MGKCKTNIGTFVNHTKVNKFKHIFNNNIYIVSEDRIYIKNTLNNYTFGWPEYFSQYSHHLIAIEWKH